MKNTFSLNVLILCIQIVFTLEDNVKFNNSPLTSTESNDRGPVNYLKVIIIYSLIFTKFIYLLK